MSNINVMEVNIEVARKIFWLLLNDHIFLSSYNCDTKDWDDGAYPTINCSDLFGPGSDAESLKIDELDDYIAVVKRWPTAGSQAWCAVKRQAVPWRELSNSRWTEEYNEAVAGIPKMLRHDK